MYYESNSQDLSTRIYENTLTVNGFYKKNQWRMVELFSAKPNWSNGEEDNINYQNAINELKINKIKNHRELLEPGFCVNIKQSSSIGFDLKTAQYHQFK